MRLSSTGWRGTVAPGCLLPGRRGEVDVDAGIADQRDFLAVVRADDDAVVGFRVLKVARLYRLDGVDRGAQLEGPADFDRRGSAALFLRDGLDHLLDRHEFE